jgi:RNA polymerase sigma factor (sigma-70 family)
MSLEDQGIPAAEQWPQLRAHLTGAGAGQTSAEKAASGAFAAGAARLLGLECEDQYDNEVTTFYCRWSGKVIGYLLNMGTDPGLAEEITDDAFLAARRRWAKIRTYERPEAYIFKIARNERSKRQAIRDKQANELCSDPSGSIRGNAADPCEFIADRAAVRGALQQLPPTLREAVTLRHIEDLAIATVADIMRITPGAVKRYTFEGLQRLRELLADFHHPGQEGGDQ